MKTIQSISEQYIQRNSTRFLDKYYSMRSSGGIVLYFNEDCTLKTEQFITKIEIQRSIDLPDNAYSEAKEYWINYTTHLIFISCFWPVKHNVPFNVYALSVFPDELIEAQGLLQSITPDSPNAFNVTSKAFELCSKVVANNPKLAEAYLIRFVCTETLFKIGLLRGGEVMSRINEMANAEKGNGMIQDLLKAESLGSVEAKRVLQDDYPEFRQLKEIKQSSNASNATKSSSVSQDACFIATAAYGTSKHPDLDILRQFRDAKLSKSMMGKGFIKVYYFISPSFAKYVQKVPVVKFLLRIYISLLCSLLVRFL